MANITRISADKKPAKTTEKKQKKVEAKPAKIKAKAEVEKQPKKVFILFRPFAAIGRYIKNSWQEMRQVRWPNRKYTWKMTIAMLVYCVIFLAFIVLLDLLFSLLFNNLLG